MAKRTPEARFWSKVALGSPDECWRWLGPPSSKGYGRFYVGKTCSLAHRFAYELLVGPIPADLTIDHTCHTSELACTGGVSCPHRLCVNPAHMEPVTRGENAKRGHHVREPQCRNGHDFNEANTYVSPKGARGCRACWRDGWHRKYQRQQSSEARPAVIPRLGISEAIRGGNGA